MGKKILVIDDDEGILEAFKAMLESADYNVETSTGSDILLKQSTDNLPDLILLDILLSGADGRKICKRLKSQKSTKHIPIIMISANKDTKGSAKEAGADDFLDKPFEMDDLLALAKKYTQ